MHRYLRFRIAIEIITKDSVCIPYKIELANLKLDILKGVFLDLLEKLRMEDSYPMNLDIAQ